MKTLAALAIVCAVSSFLASAADAGQKHRHYRHHGYSHGYVVIVEEPRVSYRRVYRGRETHDDVRANSADPSGNLAGYPSWARAALGNHGRRR